MHRYKTFSTPDYLSEFVVRICVALPVVDVRENSGDKMTLNQNHSEAGGVIVNNSER